MIRVAALHRYPVKGLSPEPLTRVALEAGAYFPGDRLFAVENGPSGFDEAAPKHLPKLHYLMLMRNESLARLATRYEDATGILTIAEGGREVARGDLGTPEGRASIEGFLAAYMGEALRGPPRLLAARPGFRFTDDTAGFVSIINRASIAALEDRLGAPVDPLRFRGNLLVEGLDAFGEFDLLGRTLQAPSGLCLRITERIVRCAATNVDPATGIRDLQIPKALMQGFGHMDFGVYAEVLASGTLSVGERMAVVEEREVVGGGLGI